MKKVSPLKKLLLFGYALVILLFCHHFIFRPLLLDWGAPESVQNFSLPGDKLTHGGQHHTRAVLVNATPEQLWPWLVQMGQERGGFYSYQWLENLFRADMHNVYTLQPDLQGQRTKGDTVWLATKEHYDGTGFQIIAEITPPASYVMVSGDDYARIQRGEHASGSWAFYLRPASDNQTWLIARSSDGNTPVSNRILRYFMFEMPHAVMEIKMLKTMRDLAEGEPAAGH